MSTDETRLNTIWCDCVIRLDDGMMLIALDSIV